MTRLLRKWFGLGIPAALLACFSLGAAAQGSDFPNRPITIVVPFPAGGVVDITGRLLAEAMAPHLKTNLIVENKAGAGGTIGAAAVARATPDGYTLLLGGSATHVFDPLLYSNLAYDPIKSFEPIGQVSEGPLVVVVNSQSKAQTVGELITEMKRLGDKGNYASNGNGTFPHLAGELFKQANDLRTVHIPYSGGAAAVTALLSGDVNLSINHIPVVQGMVKADRLRVLATAGAERSSSYPNVPTLQEAGMKGLVASAWFGLFAPAGTPKAVVDRLSAAVAAALKNPSLKEKLLAQGDDPTFKGPADLKQYVEAESQRWSAVVRKANIQLN